jgi:hypothetical protein
LLYGDPMFRAVCFGGDRATWTAAPGLLPNREGLGSRT